MPFEEGGEETLIIPLVLKLAKLLLITGIVFDC